jgi:subfamily B ATP-binding cassette protein HlyB/CyaB
LIFDEATSALDYESERVIQENMRAMCEGRTVFIIAHRLTTVRHADRIVVVEGGSIVENGSHDELIACKGYYSRLFDYQNTSIPIKTRQPQSSGNEPQPQCEREEKKLGFAYGPEKIQAVRLT